MINSMTGFGRGSASHAGATATVEIKSVNKRHHDVSVRMPGNLAEKESAIQSALRDTFERGQFTVYVDVESDIDTTVPYRVDEDATAKYAALLRTLQSAAGIDEPITLDDLLRFDNVLTEDRPDDDALLKESWAAVEAATQNAIQELAKMRAQEGRALREDLENRLEAIEDDLEAVEARAPERVREHQQRLRDRLAEIVEDERIDNDRIETEIAVLADKLDISEECVRLRSHIAMFRESIEDDEPSGRKLKFITQEIHREVNTIGAKANDPSISGCGVRMKEEVEKIREQVRNVE
ncbi:YicC family protein [Longibacter salinarum]|uniref:YicC family protein n=1 Tax=Longibacter salinarum TaxID=1850348 RepID=A0A2A8CVC3_9BACT|nr:YicC/YloC family endoribonuclease [Longibacter salinarum]PEN12551.1 YicC family protein [Longibacter salinarum]